MRWQAQVLHVARKDLRRTRWLVLAYVAAVALSTIGVVGARGEEMDLGRVLLFLVFGAVVCAMLVQSDSPTRRGAFWTLLPVRPTAVYCAKLLVILMLLLSAAAGHAVALHAYGVRGAAFLPLLGEPVLYYAVVLALAAAVAAVTRDLQDFMLVMIGAALAWGLLYISYFGSRFGALRELPTAPIWLALGLVCGALVLLRHLYRTRRVRAGAWMSGGLLVIGGILPFLGTGVDVGDDAGAHRIAADPRPPRVSVEVFRLGGRPGSFPPTPPELQLRIERSSPTQQHVLVDPTIELHGRDGSVVPVPIAHDPIGLSGWTERPPLPGVDWISPEYTRPSWVEGFFVTLSEAQKQAIAAGEARLIVRARVEAREPRVVVGLPLEEGRSAALPRGRVRIDRIDPAMAGSQITISLREIGTSWQPFGGMPTADQRMYVLVSDARGEAVELRSSSSSRGGSFSLVLPGTPTQRQSESLIPIGEPNMRGPDAAWLAGARLLIVEGKPVANSAVRIDVGESVP
jgi:hypothetical protein